jgi:hypothetical protein
MGIRTARNAYGNTSVLNIRDVDKVLARKEILQYLAENRKPIPAR